MRRAMAALVMVAAMVPAPVMAQGSPTMRFGLAIGRSDIGTALGTMSADVFDMNTWQSVRDAVAKDREALASIVPDACLLPVYTGYVEALTLADLSVVLAQEFELEAATLVMSMVGERVSSLDVEALRDCF